MSREKAFELLKDYTKNENLIKHALAVEAAMRFYAKYFGFDEDEWGITGLLHDFDYEKYPDDNNHPTKGAEILRKEGYPNNIINAILGHSDHTGIPRDTKMAKTLYAVDELCGFIVAVTLVRPTKKLDEVEITSVKKKLKDKAFAKQVCRNDIMKGAEALEVKIDEHIGNCIKSLKTIKNELGL